MARSRREIKKYANRRLYDTRTSQSITLQDVRDLIGRGENVSVIEAKSGKDVTRQVLLQIVADQEMMGRPLLSNAFLEGMIRINSNPMRDLARRSLEKMMTQLDSQRKSLENAWSATLNQAGLEPLGVPLESFRQFQRQMLTLWSEALSPSLRTDAPPSGPESGEDGPTAQDRSEPPAKAVKNLHSEDQ